MTSDHHSHSKRVVAVPAQAKQTGQKLAERGANEKGDEGCHWLWHQLVLLFWIFAKENNSR